MKKSVLQIKPLNIPIMCNRGVQCDGIKGINYVQSRCNLSKTLIKGNSDRNTKCTNHNYVYHNHCSHDILKTMMKCWDYTMKWQPTLMEKETTPHLLED